MSVGDGTVSVIFEVITRLHGIIFVKQAQGKLYLKKLSLNIKF